MHHVTNINQILTSGEDSSYCVICLLQPTVMVIFLSGTGTIPVISVSSTASNSCKLCPFWIFHTWNKLTINTRKKNGFQIPKGSKYYIIEITNYYKDDTSIAIYHNVMINTHS